MEDRGGYSGTIIGALIVTLAKSILTLLDMPERISQNVASPAHLKTLIFRA